MISCDSMQVYRGMPILTQSPTKAECKRLKAHLVSFMSPAKEYNAALFRKDAQKAIEKAQQQISDRVNQANNAFKPSFLTVEVIALGDDGNDNKKR